MATVTETDEERAAAAEAAEPEEPQVKPEEQAAAAATPAVVDPEQQRRAEVDRAQAHAVERLADAALAMPGMAGRDEFVALAMQARVLSMSGAAPKAIKGNPHVALHIAMIGRDLGISPSAAVELIDVIDTKQGLRPSLSPQLINGQIRRLGLGSIVPAVQLEDRCVAVALEPHGRLDARCRPAWPNHVEDCRCMGILGDTEFTWEDAQNAALAGKQCRPNEHKKNSEGKCPCNQGYRTYPKRMMWWRAAGYCADDWFPEAGLGLYCVPRRAEALTRDGWVGPDKLQVGDEVLAYDADADVCRWVPVTAIHTYDAAQTYRIEHGRWRFTATAGHRWVIRRKGWPSNRNPGREFRETSAIQRGAGTVVLAAPLEGGGDRLSDRDGAILGWLLTDGSFYWRPGRRGGEVRGSIVQAKHVAEVRSLLGDDATESVMFPERDATIKGHEYHMRETFVFRLRAPFLRSLMERAGIRSKADATKIVARLTPAGRQAMLEAMLLANGHDASKGPSGQTHVTFHTGNRDVLAAFQSLAACCGIALGHERFANGCWTVTLRKSAGVEAADLSVVEHDVEPVWCPTTPLGTWVCRLDGYVSITGNSAEELGAVVDADGRAIDVSTVEVPEGYEPIGGGSGGGGEALTPADGDAAWQLQLRVYSLPEDAQAEFKERWRKAKVPGSLTNRFDADGKQTAIVYPAQKQGMVDSLLRGVEQQWKAQGKYDPEAGVRQFTEEVLNPAVGRLLGWLSVAFGATPPDSAPAAAQDGPGEPEPPASPNSAPAPDSAADAAGAADGEPVAAAPDGALPLETPGDPTDSLLSIPEGLAEASDDDKAEWVIQYVKAMGLGLVDELLRRRYGADDKGVPNDRRARLAELIAEHELGVDPDTGRTAPRNRKR